MKKPKKLIVMKKTTRNNKPSFDGIQARVTRPVYHIEEPVSKR
jgi:hypothetical protein